MTLSVPNSLKGQHQPFMIPQANLTTTMVVLDVEAR
jgi:hypothetical protein